MIVAIVGRSHLSDQEYDRATYTIETLIQRLKNENKNLTIVTGDASGIDNIVRNYTKGICSLNVIQAKFQNWNSYKERNQRIAKLADYVYSITTKFREQACYHCNEGHERTGGCYTLKIARSLGKKGEVIII